MALPEPIGNRRVQLINVAGEEVVSIFHHNQPVFAGKRVNDGFHFFSRAELILRTLNK